MNYKIFPVLHVLHLLSIGLHGQQYQLYFFLIFFSQIIVVSCARVLKKLMTPKLDVSLKSQQRIYGVNCTIFRI